MQDEMGTPTSAVIALGGHYMLRGYRAKTLDPTSR
jgi:hypothetical protein